MHDDRKRQLLGLYTVLFIALSVASARAAETVGVELSDKLQAAKILESKLFAEGADQEARRKIDRVYGELAVEFPGDPRVLNAHGEALWNGDERERAVALWESAERIDPKSAPILGNLANAALAAGEVKKAAALSRRALANAPTEAARHFAVANLTCLFRHELTDSRHPTSELVLVQALEHFREASRLAPQNAEYVRAYAETFYLAAQPDWSAALDAWRRFLELAPQKDFALANLARVHLRLGQKREAKECLDRIQAPEFEKLKRTLERQLSELDSSLSPR